MNQRQQRLVQHVVLALAAVLAVNAFICAIIAVWQPSNSHARQGFGGTAFICGLTAFLLAIIGGLLSSYDD